ncbi:MAG: response regulator, partial [Myxococcota bacterium]
PPEAPATILVVDDNDAVRDTLTRLLRFRGHTVTAADRASTALRLADEQPFDLVLTDVVMPEMSGPELARELQRRHGDLPVLFMSGYLAEEQVPADQLITKPIDVETLHAHVDAALARARPHPNSA